MTFGRIFLLVVFIALVGGTAYLLTTEPETGNRQGFGGRSVSVIAEAATTRPFSDIVEAIGTARAVRSTTITARVTDTVDQILFDDGQVVLEGDLLVKLISREEEALLEEAKSNVVEADQQYERIKNLVTRGNASNSDLDAQLRRVREAQSRLRAAEARLEDQQVKAPYDGVLGFRQVSLGSLVTPTTAITTLDKVETIYLDFSVPERFLSVLQPDLIVSASVEAFPDRQFSGTVKTVSSRVDPATRSVLVRAEVKNDDLLLRPGMLMTVKLTAREWEAVGVPEEAIVPTAGKTYIHIVEDGTAYKREVQLGIRRPGYVEVLSGVAANDLVVTEGAFRLGREPTPVSLSRVAGAGKAGE